MKDERNSNLVYKPRLKQLSAPQTYARLPKEIYGELPVNKFTKL